MRLIGLDVGDRRIGVARVDTGVKIAIPYGTVLVDGAELEEIVKIAQNYGTDLFVIGLPRNSAGVETAQSAKARAFGDRLQSHLHSARIHFQDESLTSVEAENRLKSRGKPYQKSDIDAEAATIILQDLIEEFARRGGDAGLELFLNRKVGFPSVTASILQAPPASQKKSIPQKNSAPQSSPPTLPKVTLPSPTRYRPYPLKTPSSSTSAVPKPHPESSSSTSAVPKPHPEFSSSTSANTNADCRNNHPARAVNSPEPDDNLFSSLDLNVEDDYYSGITSAAIADKITAVTARIPSPRRLIVNISEYQIPRRLANSLRRLPSALTGKNFSVRFHRASTSPSFNPVESSANPDLALDSVSSSAFSSNPVKNPTHPPRFRLFSRRRPKSGPKTALSPNYITDSDKSQDFSLKTPQNPLKNSQNLSKAPQNPPEIPQNPAKSPHSPEAPISHHLEAPSNSSKSSPSPTSKSSPNPSSKFPLLKFVSRLTNLQIAFLATTAVALIALGGALIWYQSSLGPVSGANTCKNSQSIACHQISFKVEPGTAASAIASSLHQQNLIKSPFAFSLYLKFSGKSATLKAGMYQLNSAMTVPEIVTALATASSKDVFSFMIKPGETLADIKKNLIAKGYGTLEIDAAFSKKYPHDILKSKPDNASLEGYLFGETYEFFRDETVENIIIRALDQTAKFVREQRLEDAYRQRGLTLHQGLTLASIIQKETTIDHPIIAQIFEKRFRSGEMLGSDVTVSYAVSLVDPKRETYRTNADRLNIDSPYNTRKYPGLPPTPISAPGAASLRAVARPADTDYLFFLTGDDQKMYYGRNSAEHEYNRTQFCRRLCAVPL